MNNQEAASHAGGGISAAKLESPVRETCRRCNIPLRAFRSSTPTYCVLCSPITRFGVYVHFKLSDGRWHCVFRPWHLTSILRVVTFRDPAKILEMARMGNAMLTDMAKRFLDREIASGSGSIKLHLDSAQYQRLCGPKPKA